MHLQSQNLLALRSSLLTPIPHDHPHASPKESGGRADTTGASGGGGAGTGGGGSGEARGSAGECTSASVEVAEKTGARVHKYKYVSEKYV